MHPLLWGSSNKDHSSLLGQQVMSLNGYQLPKIRPFDLSNKEIFCKDVIKLAHQLNASVLFRENRLPVSLGTPGSVDPSSQEGVEQKSMKEEEVSSQGDDPSSHGDVDVMNMVASNALDTVVALSSGSDSA